MATPYNQFYEEMNNRPTSRPLQTPNPFSSDRDSRLQARDFYRENRSGLRDQGITWQDVVNLQMMQQTGQQDLLNTMYDRQAQQNEQARAQGRYGGIRESARNPGYGETKSGLDWLQQNWKPELNPFESVQRDARTAPQTGIVDSTDYQLPAVTYLPRLPAGMSNPSVQTNQLPTNYAGQTLPPAANRFDFAEQPTVKSAPVPFSPAAAVPTAPPAVPSVSQDQPTSSSNMLRAETNPPAMVAQAEMEGERVRLPFKEAFSDYPEALQDAAGLGANVVYGAADWFDAMSERANPFVEYFTGVPEIIDPRFGSMLASLYLNRLMPK